MAIIALPVTTRFAKKIEWTLDRPAQVNRSAYSGGRTVVANPWQGRWSAKVDLLPIIGETAVRPWRAFLARLKGPINTFRLPATEGAQAVANVVNWDVGGAVAGATTMLINNTDSGLVPPGLKTGMLVTVNDQLLLVTADETPAGGGTSMIVFEPPLRAGAANGTVIETKNPTCLVALTGSSISWGVEPGKIYGVGSLAVEESW